MKLFILTFLAALSCTGTLGKIEVEDGVLVLTKDNIDEAIEKYDYMLVEFYAPWCGHCKALAPEYAKAALKLEETGSEVKLAKVDATIETELAEKHGVQGYPTLKFYRKGSPIDYGGGRRAEEIINWVNKKTSQAAKSLLTVEEAKAFIEADEVVVVGFFKDVESPEAKVFSDVASVVDEYPFGITSNEEVFNEYNVQDGKIVIFKKFDEGRAEFADELDMGKLQNFITLHSLPLAVEFNHSTARKIFSGDIKSHLLLFLSKEAGQFDKYVEDVKELAKKFREKVLFVTINTDEADHERILEFFGMKRDDAPAMRIIDLDKDMTKYKPAKPELTSENILEFVTAFVEGRLERNVLEQDLPEDWDKNPVKILVRSNFQKVAFDESKNVLVEFYAPWCGHCQKLAPIYDELGEKYKDREDLVIAKIDAAANELEDVRIVSYPTIIYYKKDTNEAVTYDGERTLEGFSKFIDSNGTSGPTAQEVQEEDENDDVPRKDEL